MFDPLTAMALRDCAPADREALAGLVAALRAGSGHSLLLFLQLCCELWLSPPPDAAACDPRLLARVVRGLVGATSWEDVDGMERALRSGPPAVDDRASSVSAPTALDALMARRHPEACDLAAGARTQTVPVTRFASAGLAPEQFLEFVQSCIAEQDAV